MSMFMHAEPYPLLEIAELALHLDAVATFVQQIQGTAHFADVMAKQKVHFQQALHTSSMSIVEAERVCAALRRIPWLNTDLEDLLGCVAMKTLQNGPSVAGRTKLQDFRCLRNYFTHEQWKVLTNYQHNCENKLELIVNQATLLGLRNPSETIAQAMSALYFVLAQGFQKAMAILPSMKYATNKNLKKHIKNNSASPVSSWVPLLDREPGIFCGKYSELYRSVFPDSSPVDCPFDVVQLQALADTIPARTTRQSMSGQPDQAMGVMQCMMAAFQQMVQNSGSSSSSLPRELPITLFPPASSSRQGTRLALPCPSGEATLELLGKDLPESKKEKDEEEPIVEKDEEDEEKNMLDPMKPAVQAKGKKKARLSIEESQRLIMKQLEERDAGKSKAKAKAKGKGKGKGKEKTAAKPKSKGKAKTAAKPKKLPSYGIEWSREQVQCRAIDGSCFAIKFKGSCTKAVKEAKAWLAKEEAKLVKGKLGK